jgi:hypothetical protein
VTSDAIAAFDQLTALRQAGVNIRVSNNSWGSTQYSQALTDAMARAEAAGILHVCAAGNSYANADLTPEYPAATGSRAIISVIATDSNDARASFSNIGMANTDLAAPGVNILSTVPVGTCQLCDPTGYKVLSGTSMAAPHVTGVAAAVLGAHPELTPEQARDVLLDPRSNDALTDQWAVKTTTGARLDFAKALQNPLALAPRLNGFPTATVGAPSQVYAGGTFVYPFAGGGSDPDGDTLRSMWWRDDSVIWGGWQMGRLIQDYQLFIWTTGQPPQFSAPQLARDSTVSYLYAVADGKGGGALSRSTITVLKSANPQHPPSGTLSVSPLTGPTGTVVTIQLPNSDPDNYFTEWDMRVGYKNGAFSAGGYTPSSAPTMTANAPGVYRISAQAVDAELDLSPVYTAVVKIGGATGEPPLAKLSVDKAGGPVPLTVNWDARASSDADGTIVKAILECDGNSAMQVLPAGVMTGSCTYTDPGPHAMSILVQDDTGYVDTTYAYVMATDGAALSSTVTSPSNNGTVTHGSTVTIAANATAPAGVAKVEFYVNSVLMCTDTRAPYTCSWHVASQKGQAYPIQAKAYDAAGSFAWSQIVNVTSK